MLFRSQLLGTQRTHKDVPTRRRDALEATAKAPNAWTHMTHLSEAKFITRHHGEVLGQCVTLSEFPVISNPYRYRLENEAHMSSDFPEITGWAQGSFV